MICDEQGLGYYVFMSDFTSIRVHIWPGKQEKAWHCRMQIPGLVKVWNFEKMGAKFGKSIYFITDNDH